MGEDRGQIELDGITYRWEASNGIVVVRGPLGEQKKTQVGNSPPESLAKIMASELARERPAGKG